MKLSDKQIESNKKSILKLLISTQRAGIESVIDYLSSSGFFYAPSSRDRHHNWRGGLAEHSLGVCNHALSFNSNLPIDSVIICGLLHDLCKASKLYFDDKGIICQKRVHIKGHGIRSIRLLDMLGLSLNDDERRAIRWHMGGHHATKEENTDLELARNSELWRVIHRADYLDATNKVKKENLSCNVD